MFNKTAGPLCVEITLEDGQTLRGKFPAPPGRTLTEFLNSGTAFIEFETFGGERTYLAKANLRVVKPMTVQADPTLPAGVKDLSGLDPYAVLGITPGADKAEAHRAYLKLAKAYHPDRYATVELPPEVHEYLAAMSRRINSARDTLEAARRDKPDPASRPEPVFTTSGRT